MQIIGLTGGYCAGKNEVAGILADYGWEVVDVDKLGHAALLQVSDQLIEIFGESIRKDDGSIDRKTLGTIVFSDKNRLGALETTVHPAMLSMLDGEIEKARNNGRGEFCINAALLYRFPQINLCDAVIEVRASLYQRVLRAQRRDRLSIHGALERIMDQKYLWDLRPKEGVPIYMLWNSGSNAELKISTEALLNKIATNARK
jgi:dephospho-CoA kinase